MRRCLLRPFSLNSGVCVCVGGPGVGPKYKEFPNDFAIFAIFRHGGDTPPPTPFGLRQWDDSL